MPTTSFRTGWRLRRWSRSTRGSGNGSSGRWARWRGCSARPARRSISNRRRARPRDIASNYISVSSTSGSKPDTTRQRTRRPQARRCRRPTADFVVARLDGDPICCSALKRVDERAGEIKRVWVAKFARGLGIAPRMLRKLEAAAREIGLTILRLDTNSALTEAQALYRKEGYREVERFNLKTAVGRLEVAAFCDFARSGCVSLARDAAAGATIDL